MIPVALGGALSGDYWNQVSQYVLARFAGRPALAPARLHRSGGRPAASGHRRVENGSVGVGRRACQDKLVLQVLRGRERQLV